MIVIAALSIYAMLILGYLLALVFKQRLGAKRYYLTMRVLKHSTQILYGLVILGLITLALFSR